MGLVWSCLQSLFFEFEGWPKTPLYQLIFQLSHAVSINFSLRSWSVMLQVDHRSLLDSHISESVKLNHQVCSCQILKCHLPLLHNKLVFPVFHLLSLHWKGKFFQLPELRQKRRPPQYVAQTTSWLQSREHLWGPAVGPELVVWKWYCNYWYPKRPRFGLHIYDMIFACIHIHQNRPT